MALVQINYAAVKVATSTPLAQPVENQTIDEFIHTLTVESAAVAENRAKAAYKYESIYKAKLLSQLTNRPAEIRPVAKTTILHHRPLINYIQSVFFELAEQLKMEATLNRDFIGSLDQTYTEKYHRFEQFLQGRETITEEEFVAELQASFQDFDAIRKVGEEVSQ